MFDLNFSFYIGRSIQCINVRFELFRLYWTQRAVYKCSILTSPFILDTVNSVHFCDFIFSGYVGHTTDVVYKARCNTFHLHSLKGDV